MFDFASLPTLLVEVEVIARAAGDEIMRVYDAGFSVQDKSDKTPLTEADIAAHQCIEKGLSALDIRFPILSEESDDIPFETRQAWETYWLVDPLDGTKEFIKRNGEFSVNIALIHQGAPVLGLVYAPVLATTYHAAKGLGAYKKVDGQTSEKITSGKAQAPFRIAASRSHPSKRMDQYLTVIGEYTIVPMGSSLKSCLVAEGKADLYPRLGLTSEWDTAACQCVVEEAGGTFIRTNGEPLRYNTKACLLNPEFFVYGDESIQWLSLFEQALERVD
jgi:3'(2'), 5'-bisphosphate nucleotidase